MATLHHQHSFINNPSPSTFNHRRSFPITHCTFFRQPRRARASRRPLLTVSSPPSPPLHATSNGAGTTVGGDGETTDAFTKYSGYLFDLRGSDFDSVTEYDLKKIASICRRNPFVLLRRLVQTGATLGKWFAVRYLDSYLERSDQMFQVRASELRNILTELGPAYIKIAQAVSSRPDLIPPTYLDELSLLQDRISPFSTEMAFNTIEAELGLTLDELFSEISPEPIAAASLGQVYRARLRPCGKIVAIKVQRPGVQAAISLDIFILRFFAGLIRRAAKLNTDLQAVVDEWASSLFREMDYTREAKNGIKFGELYGGLQDVMVPKMYLEKTTRRVLVMEWVEGQRLSEVKDLYLVEVGVYCSLNQLLEYGFYHADPHPGNLIRTSDGKLAYIDFGMMGEFKLELREGFIEACLHLVNRDFNALANDFVTLGLLPPTAEKEAVTQALTGVFQSAVDKGVRNISFGDLLGDLGRTMYKFKFQLPSYFSLVIRSLAVLEGIALSANPDYKVLGSTYPWIAQKVLTDSSPQLRSSLQALIYQEGVFRIDRLESLLAESLRAKTEKSSDKSETEDIDSKKLVKQILSFTLDDKGTFVREILLQELAKGLDALGMATIESSIPFTSPNLMTEEDYTNLSNLHRLSRLLSGFQSSERSTDEVEGLSPYNTRRGQQSEGISTMLNNLASFREILPVISVIPELSPESQQQLRRLPSDLAGKLFSRVAARTLRRKYQHIIESMSSVEIAPSTVACTTKTGMRELHAERMFRDIW